MEAWLDFVVVAITSMIVAERCPHLSPASFFPGNGR